MAERALAYRQLSLSVKYASVLFPFDTLEFARLLPTKGYIVDASIGPVPFGARVEVSGIIGTKPGAAVRIDASRGVLGIEAEGPGRAADELESAEDLLRSGLAVNSPGLAHYYEFLAMLTAVASSPPATCWARWFAEHPLVGELSRALAIDVLPFGIKVASRSGIPNQPDWCEARVEPLVTAPSSHHLVQVIYRRTDRAAVLAFARAFPRTVQALLRAIESRAGDAP